MLYETDMQLRPDGASGLLVSTLEAFKDYQQHKAWVWEHQAITRARFSAGDMEIGKAFERIRFDVLAQQRDINVLKKEVFEMRQKMRVGHIISSEVFDLKQSLGGIIDVEFMVQYLVLAKAHQHPEVAENIGNIALLARFAGLGVITIEQAEGVANAYREFRKKQHALRLQGHSKAQVAMAEVAKLVEPVRALWMQLMV
jgi:glutamate-ammonia-ligase adenylyltransferase